MSNLIEVAELDCGHHKLVPAGTGHTWCILCTDLYAVVDRRPA